MEPIGALLTVLFAGLFVPAMPYLLSFAEGAMIYVVVEELLLLPAIPPLASRGAMIYVVMEELPPEMSAGEYSNIGVLMFVLGFTVMMALDVALG